MPDLLQFVSRVSFAPFACLFITLGCSTATPAPAGDQLPASADEFPAFVRSMAYSTWRCEAAPHPARTPSPHGTNRICQNAIADAASNGNGNWPVGAAWVKEQYDADGDIFAYEISRREASADGSTAWRFWRGAGSDFTEITNNGTGDSFCSSCHQGGERDFVFTVVR